MTEDQIQTIGKLADKFEYDNVYGEALRAALTLAGQRCERCRHWDDTRSTRAGWGTCRNPQASGNQAAWHASDGCRLGWEAK